MKFYIHTNYYNIDKISDMDNNNSTRLKNFKTKYQHDYKLKYHIGLNEGSFIRKVERKVEYRNVLWNLV